MKILLVTVISLLTFSAASFAQVKSISGTVLDKDSNSPLPGVTIVVLQKSTEKLLGGSASSEKGTFDIKGKFPEKEFFLRLSFVGYETVNLDSFTIKDDKITLGNIIMHTSAIMTSTVQVTGQRPMVEYHIDKQVINMDVVPGSKSGSVTDALKNTGVVEVDPSSNKISVRGNGNVNILIDGKPQAMADNLLAQMPATYVDKVEVVTTPSAKDDPEGEGGTINIITKKNHRDNLNGSLSLYSSTQQLGFGSFVFNYRKDKLNVFSSVNTYVGQFRRTSSGGRYNYQSDIFHSQLSTGYWTMKGYMGGVKLGLDYDIDTLNSFSVTGNYNKTNGKMINGSHNDNYNILNEHTYSYDVNDDGQGDFNNWTLSANYKKKFDTKGNEITADAFYSDMINSTKDLLKTDYDYLPLYPGLQNNVIDVTNKTLILNSDYVNPTQDLGKFEAGYKFTLRNRTTDLANLNFLYSTNQYEDTMHLSNTFQYKEYINAAYFMYTNKLSFLEYKLGLRAENTITDGKQLTTHDYFSTNYISWFPSIGLAYKMNELFQLSLNASRKINRPQMEMLNPFVKVTGPNAIMLGNPKLAPTFTNSFELKFNPFLNLYYNFSNGRPSQISLLQDDSVSVSTTINSAVNKTYGFELTIPIINEPRFPVKLPDWFAMLNFRISFSRFIDEGGYRQEIYSIKRDTWRFTGMLSLNLIEDIKASAYFQYYPANGDERYHWSTTTWIGMSLSRDFFDKKLTVSLNANDIFAGVHPFAETWGSNFYTYSTTQYIRNRSVGLSIRYNFNDFTDRKEKNIDDGRDKDGGMFGNNGNKN